MCCDSKYWRWYSFCARWCERQHKHCPRVAAHTIYEHILNVESTMCMWQCNCTALPVLHCFLANFCLALHTYIHTHIYYIYRNFLVLFYTDQSQPHKHQQKPLIPANLYMHVYIMHVYSMRLAVNCRPAGENL